MPLIEMMKMIKEQEIIMVKKKRMMIGKKGMIGE